jgi:predicted DNA-binding protein (MmcQ/YjbR family)
MNTPWVRRLCLSLPHTTESVQWGEHLVFKIGGKIYAIAALEPADAWLSFKTAPDEFARLTETPGIIPAPYLARAQWVALETFDALPAAELERLIRDAYGMIFAKLPRKTQAELAEKTPRGKPPKAARAR